LYRHLTQILANWLLSRNLILLVSKNGTLRVSLECVKILAHNQPIAGLMGTRLQGAEQWQLNFMM
jgi:hypothetical protein